MWATRELPTSSNGIFTNSCTFRFSWVCVSAIVVMVPVMKVVSDLSANLRTPDSNDAGLKYAGHSYFAAVSTIDWWTAKSSPLPFPMARHHTDSRFPHMLASSPVRFLTRSVWMDIVVDEDRRSLPRGSWSLGLPSEKNNSPKAHFRLLFHNQQQFCKIVRLNRLSTRPWSFSIHQCQVEPYQIRSV